MDIRKNIKDLVNGAVEEAKKDIMKVVIMVDKKDKETGSKEGPDYHDSADAAVWLLACADVIGKSIVDTIMNARQFERTSSKGVIPCRGTEGSAGYDLISPTEVTIGIGQTVTIPLGIRAMFPKDEVLMIYPRSSMGKKGIVLANTVAVIDSDYYGNDDNDGEIMLMLRNEGEESYFINAGDKIAQAIFVPFFVTDNDQPKSKERTGGIGSTGA